MIAKFLANTITPQKAAQAQAAATVQKQTFRSLTKTFTAKD